jgi:beta-lactamase regulating signal transducer with metallopeptidase domain
MIANQAMSSLSAWAALGWAAIHFLWQGAVIGLAAAALLRCMQRRSPEARYVVACTALFLCLATFGASFFILLGTHGPLPNHPIERILAGLPGSVLPDSAGLNMNIAGVAAYCWLAGFLWMMMRYTCQWIHVQRLRNCLITRPDDHLQAVFESLKRKLKIPQAVRLFHSGMAKSAMVAGCFRPVVLVPLSALTALTPDQLRAVIAHELSHIRRHDPWINMAQGFTEMVLFFHPAVWWLSRQVRNEREYCCDESSVRVTGSSRTLAQGLALLESLRIAMPAASLAATGGSLLARIARLVGAAPANTKQRANDMANKAVAVIAAAVLLIGCSYLAQTQEPSDESPKIEAKAFTVEEYMRAEREIRKLVADGKASPEDAQTRLVEMRRAIANSDSVDRRQENLEAQTEGAGSISVEEYRAAEKRIRKLVEDGNVSVEDAEIRLREMRALISE